jgi:hypothetical protein
VDHLILIRKMMMKNDGGRERKHRKRERRPYGSKSNNKQQPPNRDKPAMTADERAKVLKELTAARDRQTSRVKAREGAAPPKPIKPEK